MQAQKPSAITVVLLPGLNGTDGLFKLLVACAPDNLNVVVISYPTHEKLTYAQLAQLVTTKLTELTTPFILVGESFSGPVALLLSRTRLQGLSGIILVSTFVTSPNLRIGRFLPWRLGFNLARPLYALRQSMNPHEIGGLVKSISIELQKVSPGTLAHRIQCIFKVNVIQELKDCPVPIAYFRGTKDFFVPSWNLRLILKHKPDVQAVEFNTQHFLLQSQPELAWQEIALFINTQVSVPSNILQAPLSSN